VLGSGAAASAHYVDKTAFRKVQKKSRGDLRRFVVPRLAQRVGKSGIRVAAYAAVGYLRELLYVRTHFLSSQRAVYTDAERFCVANGVPESLHSLSRKSAPGSIRYGNGDHDRNPFSSTRIEKALNSVYGRFQIQGVKSGLRQKYIHPSLDKGFRLLAVSLNQFVKRNRPVRRIIDVRGH